MGGGRQHGAVSHVPTFGCRGRSWLDTAIGAQLHNFEQRLQAEPAFYKAAGVNYGKHVFDKNKAQ